MPAIGTSTRSALSRLQSAYRFRTHLEKIIKLFMRDALLTLTCAWPLHNDRCPIDIRVYQGELVLNFLLMVEGACHI
jgi:hypothetical protein